MATFSFHEKSFSEVNPEHKSKYAAWETPDPVFWTTRGYVVVRADECGLGQSPGILDTMSAGTADCFTQVVEWAAKQSWSSGKVGLLGVSYYAGMLVNRLLCPHSQDQYLILALQVANGEWQLRDPKVLLVLYLGKECQTIIATVADMAASCQTIL